MPSFRVTKMPLFSGKLVSVKKFVKTLFRGCKVNMDARIQDLLVLKEPDKSLSLIHERLVSVLSRCRKSGDNRGKGSIFLQILKAYCLEFFLNALFEEWYPVQGQAPPHSREPTTWIFFLDTRLLHFQVVIPHYHPSFQSHKRLWSLVLAKYQTLLLLLLLLLLLPASKARIDSHKSLWSLVSAKGHLYYYCYYYYYYYKHHERELILAGCLKESWIYFYMTLCWRVFVKYPHMIRTLSVFKQFYWCHKTTSHHDTIRVTSLDLAYSSFPDTQVY